jgi:SAM-dependent methyltransferase
MTESVVQTYDRIGVGYARRRQADGRIAAHILAALGDTKTIVNVGAGAGSYEPTDRQVVGIEPAMMMIRQRGPTAAPAVCGYAEALPFAAGAFAAALAVLTIHHWSDWRAGLREMQRVARARMVLLTWDPDSAGFWLHDYLPDLLERDKSKFPSLSALQEVTGPAEIVPVPIPHDCRDGFMGAYWRRPAAYLVPDVRQAISTLATGEASVGLERLAADLANGEWERRYGSIAGIEQLDIGYRLVITGGANR